LLTNLWTWTITISAFQQFIRGIRIDRNNEARLFGVRNLRTAFADRDADVYSLIRHTIIDSVLVVA